MQGKEEGADLLREHRLRLGLSVRAAARALGVSHVTYRNWELKRLPPSAPFRHAIEVWTRGVVLESAWPLSEREKTTLLKVGRVRPHSDPPRPPKTGTHD